MAFLVIKDITGKLQVTLEKEKYPELAALVDQLTIHSVVSVEGEVVANEYVKMGGIEMLPDALTIHSIADALPIKAIIHIQKTEPKPPMQSAVETPMMLPVPTRDAVETISA
jgi:aspartyl/asparaginyl-tRNA synthetase